MTARASEPHTVTVRSASLFALSLFFSVGITGQDEQSKNELSTFPCGPKTFTVSPTFGVTPYVIYVCDNDEVTWKGNSHKFKVTFKGNKCPFNETCDDISDTNPNPDIKKHARPMKKITIFLFSVKVDDGKPFDPIVIGGGGHGIGPAAKPQTTK